VLDSGRFATRTGFQGALLATPLGVDVPSNARG
jgi:hypothetical protein